MPELYERCERCDGRGSSPSGECASCGALGFVPAGVTAEEVGRLRGERDALMRLVVQPWTRDDGMHFWKINLAWQDTADTEAAAVAAVRAAAGLPDAPDAVSPSEHTTMAREAARFLGPEGKANARRAGERLRGPGPAGEVADG